MLKKIIIISSCFFMLTSCAQQTKEENEAPKIIEVNNEDITKNNETEKDNNKNNEKDIIEVNDENKNDEVQHNVEVVEKNEGIEGVDASQFEKYQISTFAFDTVLDIVIYSNNENEANKILKKAEEICYYYDNLLNKTKNDSLVYKLNENKKHTLNNSKEDEILLEIINKSIYYSEITNGYFDITISPLVELWGIGDGRNVIPNKNDIENSMNLINYKNIEVTNNEILLEERTTIDVGGIAKGFIADEVKQLLVDNDVKYGLLNFGGNVLTIGDKPSGDSYVIGLRNPHGNISDIIGTVKVKDKSVVTSGVYERFFMFDGVRYHHILDPKTGFPSNNGLLSVTIISEHSIDGDAFSTSLFLLGVEDGLNLVNGVEGIEAMFITKSGDYIYSENFKDVYDFNLMN